MATSTEDLNATEIPDGAWTVDSVHSVAGFSVRHMVVGTFRGEFREIDASLTDGKLVGRVKVASLNLKDERLTGHLLSPDFFDAERYPVMTFASRALRLVDGSWVLSGELTIRDVTRLVDLEVEFLGIDPTGLQGEPRIGFSVRGPISRRDFGITFGLAVDGTKIVVADKVDITLDVEAFLGA
jgi:polyisoprenoid-binding protein YceI